MSFGMNSEEYDETIYSNKDSGTTYFTFQLSVASKPTSNFFLHITMFQKDNKLW